MLKLIGMVGRYIQRLNLFHVTFDVDFAIINISGEEKLIFNAFKYLF